MKETRTVAAGFGFAAATAVSLLACLPLVPAPGQADKSPLAGPTSRPADPFDTLLAAGWGHLELVNYPAAQETLQKVLRGDPTRPQRAEAMFALGHLWQHRRPDENVPEARSLYAKVAREFHDTPSAPLALIALARLADGPEYEKDRNRDEARRLYGEFLRKYPTHFLAHEALLRLAMTYLEDQGARESEDEGIRLLTQRLAAHPANFLAVPMNIQLGGVYQRREEYRKAIGYWIAADAADARSAEAEIAPQDKALPPRLRAARLDQYRVMDRSNRASLYFRIAKVAETKLQDYALAVTWYERIVTEIRRDNKFYVSILSARRCRNLAAEAGVPLPPPPPELREDEP